MSKKDFVATIYVFKHNFIVRKPNWNDCIAIIISTQGTNLKIEDKNSGTSGVSKLVGYFNPFAIFSLLVTSWHLNCFPWLHFKIFFILSKFWLPQKESIKLSRIFFHLWVNFDVMNFPTQNQNHELSERIFNCRRRMKVKRTLNSYFVFIFTDKIRSSFLVILFESHNSMKTKRTFTVVVKFSPPWISQDFLERVPFGSPFTKWVSWTGQMQEGD